MSLHLIISFCYIKITLWEEFMGLRAIQSLHQGNGRTPLAVWGSWWLKQSLSSPLLRDYSRNVQLLSNPVWGHIPGPALSDLQSAEMSSWWLLKLLDSGIPLLPSHGCLDFCSPDLFAQHNLESGQGQNEAVVRNKTNLIENGIKIFIMPVLGLLLVCLITFHLY